MFLEQIGTSTDTTVNIDIDGNNNSINLSMEGTGNELNFKQEGNNNTISWVSYWGSGKAWGGDLDGNNNTFKICLIESDFDLPNNEPSVGTTRRTGMYFVELLERNANF